MNTTLLAHSFVAPTHKNEENLIKLKQLFSKHEAMSVKLYELLIYASDNTFMINGSKYEPCKNITETLKNSYNVFGHSFDQVDLKTSLKILKTWIEKTQATNVSTFFSTALKIEDISKAVEDLENIKASGNYKEASIEVRKLSYSIIKSAGFLNFDGFESKEIKSIIKSVQGSIKSTNSC